MKIENSRSVSQVSISFINAGECFISDTFERNIFIRVAEDHGLVQSLVEAVCLQDGVKQYFNADDKVIPVNVVGRIEK